MMSRIIEWVASGWRKLVDDNHVLNDIKDVVPTLGLVFVIVNLCVTTCQNSRVNSHNEATDRPWILSSPVANLVTVTKEQAEFDLRFRMENVGHTPAFDAWVSWSVVGILNGDPTSSETILTQQSSQCLRGGAGSKVAQTHDWSRLDAMTEEERHAAAVGDVDARPLTDVDMDRIGETPWIKSIRRVLGLTQEEFATWF